MPALCSALWSLAAILSVLGAVWWQGCRQVTPFPILQQPWQLTGSLVDVMYIFDEPSVGLHPHDVHRLNELQVKLRDKGNTAMVVEHDPEVIKVADYVVDLGPYAGSEGGQVGYQGTYAGQFSFNSKGACPNCQGLGVTYTDLGFPLLY